MPLRARQRLLATLIDGALAKLPKKHVNAIAEQLIKRGLELVERTFDVQNSADVIMLHPEHETTRLLAAINAHIEKTNEDGDVLVARLIACMGSQAAYGSQPN